MINVLMIEDDPEFAQILSEYLSDFNIKDIARRVGHMYFSEREWQV